MWHLRGWADCFRLLKCCSITFKVTFWYFCLKTCLALAVKCPRGSRVSHCRIVGLKDLVGTSVVVTMAEQRGVLHPQKLKLQQQQQSEGLDATVPPTARLTGEVRCRNTEHQSRRRNQIKKSVELCDVTTSLLWDLHNPNYSRFAFVYQFGTA